jgi:hypothetical protein
MDNTRGTAARLRRTFQYPDDNHSDSEGSEPEAMDEEGTFPLHSVNEATSNSSI